MGTLSLADLGKTRKLHQGLPSQEERVKFKQEVVVGRGGIYLSYLSDFFDIVYCKEEFDSGTSKVLQGVGVPEVTAGLTISEKIPSGMIYRMVAWYRHINELYGTEATMQVFYDKTGGDKDFPQELKDMYQGAIQREGNFVYIVPVQNVTGGHVTFDGDQFPMGLDKELYDWAIANYEPVLNIHSHNSMSAFWSGEDDRNELPLYTRLCLVIGKVNTDEPMFRFSWNFEGKRHHYEATIDGFIEPLEITTEVKGLGYKITKEMGFKEALGYLDFDELEFDEHWDEQIMALGRGKQAGQYLPLGELTKEAYTMTPREFTVAKDLAVNGSYEDGVKPDLTSFEALEDTVIGLEDMPEEDMTSEPINETSEEPNLEWDNWKHDLVKAKVSLEDDDVSGVVNDASTFRNNGKGGSGHPSKKSQNVYEKFKQDQLRKERMGSVDSEDTVQGGIWDDFNNKY